LLPPGATNKLSPNGLLGGVTAGYNLQTSNLVFGLEGDFDLTSARASFSDNRCGGLCWTHSAKLSSFADARVRLGYAFDRFLPFVTGGVVYGNISNTFYDSPGDINSSAGPFTLGRGASFGWTVGGGGEYALDSHWSIKAQYLYMQFPDVTRVAPGGYAFKFKDSAQVAEVGVNYRF
jgi:outer membrane immunogenic protein